MAALNPGLMFIHVFLVDALSVSFSKRLNARLLG
jgi:hypothetical protein